MPQPIRLLVTDVDGTLVKHDRTLAPSTIEAAARLRKAGVALALVSSRPPGGLDILIDPLGIDTPRAGFNGGLVLDADGVTVLEEYVIPEAACRQAVALLEGAGIDVWVFARGAWYLKNDKAAYIPREQLSISMGWEVVTDFAPFLAEAHKVMASSTDFAAIATADAVLRQALGTEASVLRSQDYYIDITHPQANKGAAALAIAKRLGIPAEAMACIGDMPNDIPMLRAGGLAIAMGNAPEGVKAEADWVVGTNDDGGWAEAAARLLA